MTGLDTNILLRYLEQDDEAQFRAALRLLTQKGILYFVSDLVLVETSWALINIYKWTPVEVVEAYERLLTITNLAFESENRLRPALRAVKKGADLADELIAASCQDCGCQNLATFDKGILKRHPRFAFLPTAD